MKHLIAIFLLPALLPALAHDAALEEAYAALYGDRARQAVATADTLVDKRPDSADAWRIKGDAYFWRAEEVHTFRKLRWLRNALAAYERAAELEPGNLGTQVILLTIYSLLPESMGGGDDRVTDQLEAMAAAVPGADLLGRSVVKRAERTDSAAAFGLLDQAISINAEEPHFRVARVQFLIDDDNWESARSDLHEALRLFPDHPGLVLQQARLAAKTAQDLDQALAALDRLAANPDRPQRIRPESLLLRRGQILEQLGEPTEAMKSFCAARASASRLVDRYGLSDRIADCSNLGRLAEPVSVMSTPDTAGEGP